VRDQIWRIAMYFQPGERLSELVSVDEAPLGAGVGAGVMQPSLHRQELLEPLDVPSRDRQEAELGRRRSRRPFGV
jgi:hypothetical protein